MSTLTHCIISRLLKRKIDEDTFIRIKECITNPPFCESKLGTRSYVAENDDSKVNNESHSTDNKDILQIEHFKCSICNCNSKTIRNHYTALMCNKCSYLTREHLRCFCYNCNIMTSVQNIIESDVLPWREVVLHLCKQCNCVMNKNMFSLTQLREKKKSSRRCRTCIAKGCTTGDIEIKCSYLTLKRTTDFKNYYNKRFSIMSMKRWEIRHIHFYGMKNYNIYVVFQYLEIKMLRRRAVRKELTISSLNLYMYGSVNQIVLSYVC
jgi:hypothetical protein